tara:strand:+ start:45 stop:866 length:822 start_codon:yes stop_codon:yes gene_type:complete
MKFIVSINENKHFLPFIKIIDWYYSNLKIQIDILLITDNKKLIKKYKKNNNVIIFKPLKGYDSGIQSKMLRHYYPLLKEEETFVVTDIDQFIINLNKLDINKFNGKNITTFGKNLFDGTELDGKTPMAPYITTPNLTKNLFGVNKKLTFEEFMFKLTEINNPIDGKESVQNNFNEFSDESLFRLLKQNNNIEFHNIDKHFNVNGDRRIDRTVSWNIKNPNIGKYFWKRIYLTRKQKIDIRNMIYFDVCPPRPPNKLILKKILSIAIKYQNLYL